MSRLNKIATMYFNESVLLAIVFTLLSATSPIAAPAQKPIRLDSRNPHYFFFRGKTIALISSGEHYGAVLNADFDYHLYLKTLESEGLNYTRLFAGSYVEVPGKSFGIQRNDLAPLSGRFIAPWKRSDTPGYAGGGDKFDLNQWDSQYFDRLRDFLTEASKRGIVVEITLFSSQYGEAQWALSPFNPLNNVNHTGEVDWRKIQTLQNGDILSYQQSYVHKLVDEVNAFPNVFFEIQNEPWSDRPEFAGVVNPYLFPPVRDRFPNSIELADSLSIEWQTRVAQWISHEESSLPNKHLIAQNICDFGLPIKQLIPGISIVNFHYAFPEAATANQGLGKVLAYDETGFLGRDDETYLRQVWSFILSGGGTFGALDYSFSVGHEDGTDAAPNGPGGGSPAFRKQLGILRDFLKALPLAQMSPDFKVVKNAGGTYPRALSSRSVYAIYFDGNGPADIALNLPAGEYSGEWLDTKAGKPSSVQPFKHRGGEKQLHSPSFQNGIALLLKKTAAL